MEWLAEASTPSAHNALTVRFGPSLKALAASAKVISPSRGEPQLTCQTSVLNANQGINDLIKATFGGKETIFQTRPNLYSSETAKSFWTGNMNKEIRLRPALLER